MQKFARLRRMSASAVVLATALVCSAVGADLRFGGRAEAWGTACPTLSGNASLDLFVGLGNVEAATRTEFSLFPYTMGTETFSISLVREWLSVGGEFRLSVVPIGITSAMVLSRAQPLPWECSIGDVLLDFSVEGEARLKGYTFATTPLRAEVWVQGTASASVVAQTLTSITVSPSSATVANGGTQPFAATGKRGAGHAGVAQLVEHDVANVVVVGSNPITRSGPQCE